MRAKYLGKTEFLVLTNGKVYEVLSVERDWYRIVDDSGEIICIRRSCLRL